MGVRCILGALALLMASGCADPAFVSVDAGCATYGIQRGQMPRLSTDAVSVWVDVLDGAMTGACHPI